MELIGMIAGALGLIGYLPQTIKTIRTKKTQDLSLATFVIIGAASVMWTVYGFSKGLPSIWATNSVIFVCTLLIIIMKLREEKS